MGAVGDQVSMVGNGGTDVVLGDRVRWTISRFGSVVVALGNDKSVGETVALVGVIATVDSTAVVGFLVTPGDGVETIVDYCGR